MIIIVETRKILVYLMRVRINFEMKEQRSYMVCDLVSDNVNLSRNLKYPVETTKGSWRVVPASITNNSPKHVKSRCIFALFIPQTIHRSFLNLQKIKDE